MLQPEFSCLMSRTEKLFPDSRRRTATTQTQNKTRQNYYARITPFLAERTRTMYIHILIMRLIMRCIHKTKIRFAFTNVISLTLFLFRAGEPAISMQSAGCLQGWSRPSIPVRYWPWSGRPILSQCRPHGAERIPS